MKFSMTGQEKGNCLIEVTAWAGLTVYTFTLTYCSNRFLNHNAVS